MPTTSVMSGMPEVRLVEVDESNISAVLGLTVTDEQADLVAPNSVSLAQAYVYADAWPRAIVAGDDVVGFLMMSLRPEKPLFYLWRFMVGAEHQGRGYGMAALELAIDHVRATYPGAEEITLSVVPRDGSATAFYERAGFVATGEMHGDEAEMKLTL